MQAGRRFVVDTNTIISGILLPQSVPGRVLHHLAVHATLIFSPPTRDELLDVISREKFDRYVAAEARELAVTILVREGELVTPKRIFQVYRDARDDKFLDVAFAGKADCLISGDHDLTALCEFKGIAILTARQYLVSVTR
jgi:uncharacterized protein